MTHPNTLEKMIVSTSELHHGRPVISGTGVAVRTVVGHYKLGLTPEEIADEMSPKLAGVYAALTYYHLNREDIEADIVANSEEVVAKEASLDGANPALSRGDTISLVRKAA